MSIDVHVRVRPGVEHSVWATTETVIHNAANLRVSYSFSKVHPTTATNTTLFRGVEGLIHAAFEGKHVTVMAYGQTGSGKTHSMLGTPNDAGIVPRAARLLLEKCKFASAAQPQPVVLLSVTEIYNDTVRDLLDAATGRELLIKDGAAPDFMAVTDARKQPIRSTDEFLAYCQTALGNRKTGVTNMNEHSSRSHMIMTLEIQRGHRVSSISLVDLAGSESAAKSNTKGIQLQEGGHINQSLLSLGNCVNAIVANRPHIPYRESKLTRLLRHCLGGSGLTCILCCVNPGRDNQDTTNAALQFAQRAMKIKNDPVVTISMGPLVTHQFINAAEHGLGGCRVTELSKAAYQRGLADAYTHCVGTAGSILTHTRNQVGLAMHAMTNAHRLLLAHEQTCGAEQLRLLEVELTRLKDAVEGASTTRAADSKRAREHDVVAQERRSKAFTLEQALTERLREMDCEVAQWEYLVYESRKQIIADTDALAAEERAARATLIRDYSATRMQTMNQFFDTLIVNSDAAVEKAITTLERFSRTRSIDETKGPDDAIWSEQRGGQSCHAEVRLLQAISIDTSNIAWSSEVSVVAAVRAHTDRLEREISDLASAYDMVKDELNLPDDVSDNDTDSEARPPSHDEESHPHRLPAIDSEKLKMTSAEIIERLRELEQQETAMKMQLIEMTRVGTARRVQDAVAIAAAAASSSLRRDASEPAVPHSLPMSPTATAVRRNVQLRSSTATPTAQRAPNSSRVSTAPGTYVSPYSQRALRSPMGMSPKAGRSCWSPPPSSSSLHVAVNPQVAERELVVGAEMRSAMHLIREAQNKLLVIPPGATHRADSGSLQRLIDDEEQLTQPLSQPSSSTNGRPLLPRPRNFTSNPPKQQATQGVTSGNGPAPRRLAAEAVQYHLSFSPQVELSLHRGTSTPKHK